MNPYYQDEAATIYHGDCREVLPSITGIADLCLTDPPYLVDYAGRWGSGAEPIVNDHGDDDWLIPAFRGIYRALKDDGVCITFYGWPRVESFMSAWRAVGFRPVSHMVWVKNVFSWGTTLRAAKDLGRKAIGVEIEERYCAAAVRALSQTVLPFEAAV